MSICGLDCSAWWQLSYLYIYILLGFACPQQSSKLWWATAWTRGSYILIDVECCCYRLIRVSDRGLQRSRVKVKETLLMNWKWWDGVPVWSFSESLVTTLNSQTLISFFLFWLLLLLFWFRSSTCWWNWTTKMKRFDLCSTAKKFWKLFRKKAKI